MINPTKEWLMGEAEAVADFAVDDILFYMQEYGKNFTYSEIAKIFSNAYNKMITQMAKEMEENEEE